MISKPFGRYTTQKENNHKISQNPQNMAAAMTISPSPYGLKAIREIKGVRNTTIDPTERLKKKVNDTRNYFYEKVDPIVGECITHLLCEQPADVSNSMLEYFQKKSRGESIGKETSSETIDKAVKKELKLYLATRIGPVVAKLINRIALEQPENVLDFICTEMVTIIEESGGDVNVQNDNTLPIQRKSKLPENSENKKSKNSPKPPSSSEPLSSPNQRKVKIVRDPQAQIEPKNVQISVIGIGGAGKSSILNLLEGKLGARVRPTMGFRPVSMMMGDEFKIRFYDLGGGKKIRDIWEQYYHDVHGIIYVVDAAMGMGSAKDEWKECASTFANAMMNPFLDGKPVLIVANKQDQEGALPGETVLEMLNIDEVVSKDRVSVMECSAFVPPDFEESSFSIDPRIEEGLEGLLNTIMERFDDLNLKVQKDSEVKAQLDEIQRLQKERYVLKCKIACAFVSLIEPAVLAPLNIIEDPKALFSEEEGVSFLAAEIGEEAANLHPLGVKIAADVGNQRLALQMVGALKVPVSKKREPMTWEQINDLVTTLRTELGLNPPN
eukprot:gene25159-33680_t